MLNDFKKKKKKGPWQFLFWTGNQYMKLYNFSIKKINMDPNTTIQTICQLMSMIGTRETNTKIAPWYLF